MIEFFKMIITFLFNVIYGFFENLAYTTMAIVFLLFLKRGYFKYVNKHIRNANIDSNPYLIDTDAHKKYNPFKKEGDNVSGEMEILKFNGDLRLRVRSSKGKIKVVSVSKYNIPVIFYWNLMYRILDNEFTKKRGKENVELTSKAMLIKSTKNLEESLTDEVAELEIN